MSDEFVVHCEPRETLGKGASRRLRRTGMIPAILYGSKEEATLLSISHNHVLKLLDNPAFYSHILELKIKGSKKPVKALLKDLQRHPANPFILHMDFLRVSSTDSLRIEVPVAYLNEEEAPGVKAGGMVQRHVNALEILCLASDLPEVINIDLGEMNVGDVIHLSDLKLPKGVEFTHPLDEENDAIVAALTAMRAAEDEPEDEEAPAAPDDSEKPAE